VLCTWKGIPGCHQRTKTAWVSCPWIVHILHCPSSHPLIKFVAKRKINTVVCVYFLSNVSCCQLSDDFLTLSCRSFLANITLFKNFRQKLIWAICGKCVCVFYLNLIIWLIKDGAYYCLCTHYLRIMQCIDLAIHSPPACIVFLWLCLLFQKLDMPPSVNDCKRKQNSQFIRKKY